MSRMPTGRGMRENSAAKARRLLIEARVDIVHRDRSKVDAIVRGDSAVAYRVRHSAGAGWSCNCEARSRCSHVQAVALVTLIHRETP